MSQLFHFGDSYSTVKLHIPNNKHFCNIIADALNMEYLPFGIGGMSNEWVLTKILENLHRFKKGDIIFINFSFFERGVFYNKKLKKLEPTSPFYNDIYKFWSYEQAGHNHNIDEISPLVKYFVNNTEDYTRRIFNILNCVFNFINKLEVKIFYIFAGSTDYEDDLLKFGTNIKFEQGFSQWLIKNGFHKEQDVHYTLGIQPILADGIMRKTDNLKSNNTKKIEMSINDFDLNKIVKANKLI